MNKKQLSLTSLLVGTVLCLFACAPAASSGGASVSARGTSAVSNAPADTDFTTQPKPATEFTAASNQAVYEQLDFNDKQEFDFAQQGLIDAPESLEIQDAQGKVVWSQKAYAFLEENAEAPATANPSQWRNAQLNHQYGLFEVVPGIYQVRGYDMTNITFVKGDRGWIVFDPLMSVECAKAAYELVRKNLGDFPISAVVISHSHVDHYGGIKGLITGEDGIPILAPAGFEEHAVSENLFAGNAMIRRAQYQYGAFLQPGETGSLAIGIGMGQSTGQGSYLSPTREISQTGETVTIDGVEMVFQLTPGTEAPAEMNTYFPAQKALWMAENCTGTLHNLYTLRGAQVRDGNAWAKFLMETSALFGAEAEVVFQSHNWPHWGKEVIAQYLFNTASIYKFINDQTLMYINQGLTANEISNTIQLPKALEQVWYTRQYYGTLSHNARAVYQKYMGFYDANPVHLNPITPEESATKMVEYLGDVNRVLEMAQADFDKGEYRWVAEITSVLIYADPANQPARLLCADALEQLGYQAESGTWRNAYLAGAYELRHGAVTDPAFRAKTSSDTFTAMTPEMQFDYMGILLNAETAQDLDLTIHIVFTDYPDTYTLFVKNGVILYQTGLAGQPSATLTMPKAAMGALIAKDGELQKQLIEIEGDAAILQKLTEHFSVFDPSFNIIEP